MKCNFDPKVYADMPIGMFHCPVCDQMVLAGEEHPDYDKLEEYLEEDRKKQNE